MQFSLLFFIILITQVPLINSTQAQEVSLGTKAGTVGAGVELTIGLSETVNIRFGGNYFKFRTEIEVEDNDYSVDLKLNNYTFFTDWYLFDNPFHLTGGIFINKNIYRGTALPNNSYVINNVSFTANEVGVLSAEVRFNPIAPYLGIGWGNSVSANKKWTFTGNIGVVFAGDPKLKIKTSEGTLSQGPLGGSTELTENIKQAEENFRTSEDLKYLDFYPVVSIGLHYHF